jgi:hypothetical protein
MLVCIRPGWPVLRELLRSSYWTAVTTHASADYAAEVARVLDPALGGGDLGSRLKLLRGGGEKEHGTWRMHALPRASLPSWAAAEVEAARQPPLLTHVACYRRGGEGEQAECIQKNFIALHAVMPCSNAFVALDDLAGGRAANKDVWAPSDAPRVLCPPPFRPFGPPEERVLERCADALRGVHAAFFDALSGGGAAAMQGERAADVLAHAVREEEMRHLGRA